MDCLLSLNLSSYGMLGMRCFARLSRVDSGSLLRQQSVPWRYMPYRTPRHILLVRCCGAAAIERCRTLGQARTGRWSVCPPLIRSLVCTLAPQQLSSRVSHVISGSQSSSDPPTFVAEHCAREELSNACDHPTATGAIPTPPHLSFSN
jgi:hypothetical protein